jgi:hypothetical protein
MQVGRDDIELIPCFFKHLFNSFFIKKNIIMINRRKFLALSSIASGALLLPLAACRKMIPLTDNGDLEKSIARAVSSGGITISKCFTEKGAYLKGEVVKVSFDIKNTTLQNITLSEVHVYLNDISNPGATFTLTVNVATNLTIAPGQTHTINNATVWTVPDFALLDAFGVHIGATFQNSTTFGNTFMSFFRVVDQTKLISYKINNSSYNALPIHTLDGGLSAEYTVVKSAEVLSHGVANSWNTSQPGYGPNSVYSTAGFLHSAVNATVDFYNQTLGATTTFDTVIISTGVASIPYLSRTTKAPVLPLHFLVSANTVKEIIAILNYNSEVKGYQSYCTLGYDGSVAMAVGWIKLLQLPQQYIDFLNQHNVKNVVIAGTYGETASGENKAKKINYKTNPSTGYNDGDLFLMFPQGGVSDDFTNLYNKLVDLHDYDGMLEPNYRLVSDWESGVVNEQLTNFANTMKTMTGVTKIRRISSADSLDMYSLATYVTLAFMKKNQTAFTLDGNPVLGVAMNPYLLAHPTYETKIKYIPMLFWQGNSGANTVSRLNTEVKQDILKYFPNTNFNNLYFWVNTCANFGGYQANNIKNALISSGLNNVTMNDNTKDEVWNPSDGMDAICEKIANNINTFSSPTAYKAWDNALSALSVADLDVLPVKHPNISVVIL